VSLRALRPRSLGVVLLTAGVTSSLAQPAETATAVPVPPGSRVRATVGDATAEVAAEGRPKVIEVRFGRVQAGRFVPYGPKERMPYDRPFVVQVRFAPPPAYDQATVTLGTDAGVRHEVPVYRVAATPEVFRSRAMAFEDPAGCRGLRFCGDE
jgi:hypothetical protein